VCPLPRGVPSLLIMSSLVSARVRVFDREEKFFYSLFISRSSPFAVLPLFFCRFAVAAYFENFFIMYKFFLFCRFAAFFCRCRYLKKKSGDDLDSYSVAIIII
jgi:hypothetical protein